MNYGEFLLQFNSIRTKSNEIKSNPSFVIGEGVQLSKSLFTQIVGILDCVEPNFIVYHTV